MASLAALAFATSIGAHQPAGITSWPAPAACGRPVTSWGAATANDVRVALLRLVVEPSSLSAARHHPAPPRRGFRSLRAELALQHLGTLPAEIRLSRDRPRRLRGPPASRPDAATVAPQRRASSLYHPPRQSRCLCPFLRAHRRHCPSRLVIPIHREGLTGGGVEFPLVVPDVTSCVLAGTAPATVPAHTRRLPRQHPRMRDLLKVAHDDVGQQRDDSRLFASRISQRAGAQPALCAIRGSILAQC
ncbi:MAG: hypothetical protein KatS3mg059_0005 [Thermomicrobiales bacterium]|nr:MAG: hypothetical protein KatS3mg059_0005 [Thermomicrobiales bacterium]